MRECDNSKIHVSNNSLLSICLLIMLDTLLLLPSLHCNTLLHFTTLHQTTLHYTYQHFTSSHLYFTTLPFGLTHLHFLLSVTQSKNRLQKSTWCILFRLQSCWEMHLLNGRLCNSHCTTLRVSFTSLSRAKECRRPSVSAFRHLCTVQAYLQFAIVLLSPDSWVVLHDAILIPTIIQHLRQEATCLRKCCRKPRCISLKGFALISNSTQFAFKAISSMSNTPSLCCTT